MIELISRGWFFLRKEWVTFVFGFGAGAGIIFWELAHLLTVESSRHCDGDDVCGKGCDVDRLQKCQS